ncbi:8098_t:CDS:2, partial [Entrophospora sp. SA101]
MEVDNLNSKRKELNEETRGQIVGMSRAGSSEREISKVLGIPKSTVHNILVHFRVTHTTKVVKEEREEKLSRSFSVPQYWKNVNLIRAVELHDPIVRESISYNVENIHEEPIDEYYFPIAEKWHDHLSYIEAKGKKTKILNVEKAEFDLANRIQYYKIYFDQRIESKGKYRFEVKLAYTHVLRPYPYEIDQNDKQYLVYEGNVYGNSAYFTESTKTNIKLPSFNIISHTEKPYPVTRLGNMISYGLYVDKEPNSYEKMVVHYEQIAAILTVRKLRRDLEISHWGGNLAVEEHLDIINDGAKLKGQFSRYKFQQSLYKLNEIVVIRDLKLKNFYIFAYEKYSTIEKSNESWNGQIKNTIGLIEEEEEQKEKRDKWERLHDALIVISTKEAALFMFDIIVHSQQKIIAVSRIRKHLTSDSDNDLIRYAKKLSGCLLQAGALKFFKDTEKEFTITHLCISSMAAIVIENNASTK